MFLRRDAILLITGGLAGPLLTSAAENSDPKTLNITLQISAQTPFTLPPDAQFEGDIHSTQSKGFPLIVTVAVGVVVTSYLTELITQVWDWAANGTVIVDTRRHGLNIQNIPFSKRELVLITDSSVQVLPRDDTTKDIVDASVRLALKAKGLL